MMPNIGWLTAPQIRLLRHSPWWIQFSRSIQNYSACTTSTPCNRKMETGWWSKAIIIANLIGASDSHHFWKTILKAYSRKENSMIKSKWSADDLKNWRTSKGLSQTQASKLLGYADRSAICRLERGYASVPMRLQLLCEALDRQGQNAWWLWLFRHTTKKRN